MRKAARDDSGERHGAGPTAAPSGHLAEIAAIGLLTAALISGLALATHDPADASWATAGDGPTRNAIGPFGANLAQALLAALGWVGYLVPLTLLALAVTTFRGRRVRLGPWRFAGGLLVVLGLACLLALAAGETASGHFPAGGFLGELLASGATAVLGTAGAVLVGLAVTGSGLLLMTRLSLHVALRGAAAGTRDSAAAARAAFERVARWRSDARRRRQQRREAAAAARLESDPGPPARPARAAAGGRAAPSGPGPAAPGGPQMVERRFRLLPGLTLRRVEQAPAPAGMPPAPPTVTPPPARPVQPRAAATAPRPAPLPTPPVEPADVEPGVEAETADLSTGTADAPGPRPAHAPTRSSDSEFVAPAAREVAATTGEVTPSVGTRATVVRAVKKGDARKRDFRLPPTSLLEEPGEQMAVSEAELMACAHQIVDKCAEFGIGGQVLHIHPGPVVTTFELKPDAGIKLSRITNLEDDLAMALRAETIRIDRIPGKSTIGIEVPNRRRELISFRELVESDVFSDAGSKLTMIVGKTIDGAPYVADLARMPHLLIAGSTGSGKSVALNSMITSFLFKATPDQVKLIMVDPKMLELGMYREIPHLLTPVVTNPKLASNALKWAVKEMEVRYGRLAGCGVRNIEQYNAWVAKHAKGQQMPLMADGQEHAALPFIVIVIDELADLMMVAAADVEDSICRLAQMARAVGIHLILATQRPSVDVITGVIKANLPARIAMRVASKVDSRTILDSNGAEQLLGKGDMLFLPSGSSRLMRLHGPYISETETAAICDYLRNQRTPEYDEKVLEDPSPSAKDGGGGAHDDELFDDAARIVIERGEASVSYLQRRLKVGYSRAARLVDMLEEDGIVGPPDGAKVRQVLVGPEWLAATGSSAAP